MCESPYRCCQIRFLKHCWVSPMYNESHSHSKRYTTLLVARGSIEGLIWKLIRFFMLIVLWTMRRLKLGINLFKIVLFPFQKILVKLYFQFRRRRCSRWAQKEGLPLANRLFIKTYFCTDVVNVNKNISHEGLEDIRGHFFAILVGGKNAFPETWGPCRFVLSRATFQIYMHLYYFFKFLFFSRENYLKMLV